MAMSPAEQARLAEELWQDDRLRAWLRTRGPEVSIVIAGRAALRAVPAFAGLTDGDRITGWAAQEIVLPCLRATAATWFASLGLSHSGEVRSAAYSAKAAAKAAAYAVGDARAAAYAARAATRAAAYAAQTARAAAYAADAVAAAAAIARRADAARDAVFVAAGGTAAALARCPLWHEAEPGSAGAGWNRFANTLSKLGDDWDVWTRWYEARLVGGPFVEAVERFRVLGDPAVEDFWKQEPAVINRAIKAVEEREKKLEPIPGVPSVYEFGWNAARKIAIIAGPQNIPELPFLPSKANHRDILKVCRTLADELIAGLANRRNHARAEYKELVEGYAKNLPKRAGTGNFLLAEAKMRELGALFMAEAGILPPPFAAKLMVLMQHHVGLSLYYPEVQAFYESLKQMRIVVPPPIEAVLGFVETILKYTPRFFEPNVAERLAARSEEMWAPPISTDPNLPPPEPSQPKPPPEMATVNEQKARWFTFTGAANKLWAAFKQGETVAKNTKAWGEASHALGTHIQEILEWLRRSSG